MKEQIRKLVAGGSTEAALELLVQCGMNDALLLQSQFNNGNKNFSIGLVEHSEWQRIQARVNFAALELANKLPTSQPNTTLSYSQPTNPPTKMENPLKRANQVFLEIQEDLDSYNFVPLNLAGYCERLDDCLKAAICVPLLDFTKLSDWANKTKTEKVQKVKETMETLLSRKVKILERLKQHVEKKNDETTLLEALNLFRKTPNTANWNRLYELLLERFQDKSLYAPTVATAWTHWDTKLKSFESDLDWSLDFKESQNETNLWNFIEVNSQIKNFNYN